jgi:hypothetical protein
MKFLLVVAIYSATAGPTLTVLPSRYSLSECQALAAVYKAHATGAVSVRTQCVGLPKPAADGFISDWWW